MQDVKPIKDIRQSSEQKLDSPKHLNKPIKNIRQSSEQNLDSPKHLNKPILTPEMFLEICIKFEFKGYDQSVLQSIERLLEHIESFLLSGWTKTTVITINDLEEKFNVLEADKILKQIIIGGENEILDYLRHKTRITVYNDTYKNRITNKYNVI